MADFLNELWSSVFTAGTTPTLIVATNVTFAALQILLFILLVVTRSAHFAILSVLCGGLWVSINWFANELKAAQAKEDEAERLRRRKKGESDWRSKSEVDDSADDEGEDTEVEESRAAMAGSTSSIGPSPGKKADDQKLREEILDAMKASGQGAESKGVGTGAQNVVGAELRQRVAEEADRSGEISTDSEWEKVSQQGDT